MNRVNKYRGQRCNDGQWVYGYYVESKRSWAGHKPHKSWIVTSVMSNGGFFNVMGRYAVKDDTVGQFTGLFDKNGTEIYEGDIIQTNSYLGWVVWNNERCQFELRNHKQGFLDTLWELRRDLYNIIGNIYDRSATQGDACQSKNPELIKE